VYIAQTEIDAASAAPIERNWIARRPIAALFLCLIVDPRIDSAVTTWRITHDPLAFGPASALGSNISHSGGRPDRPVALPCGAEALPRPAARTLSPWL
jgi:hypothetical protein